QASFAPARASPFAVTYPRLAPWAAFLRRFAAPHHHSNQGEQAVTSVTSIVVDLLRYEMPRVKNLRFVQVVAKIIGRFASQVFLSTSGDARVYICFLARVVIAHAWIYFRKVP